MDLHPLLALDVPWPLLDPTATAQSKPIKAYVLPVRELQGFSVQNDLLQLLLVILFWVVGALEFFLVLRVERLIHTILESEFLITANDYRDERVDEARHTTYYRKSLVKSLDGVLAFQHFSALDHVKGEPTVV